MNTYVHALAADRDALLDFVDDAESSFMRFGIAPDIGRPLELPAEEAREYAQASPTAASADGWLPYLTPAALNQISAAQNVHYVGVSGMAVIPRVLREQTGSHSGVVLQSHTYIRAPSEYTVYRYESAAAEFTEVASDDYA